MFPHLQNMFKGLFRESGKSFDDRAPLVIEVLIKMIDILDLSAYDHIVTAAFLTLAVQALLNTSEYAVVASRPSDIQPYQNKAP